MLHTALKDFERKNEFGRMIKIQKGTVIPIKNRIESNDLIKKKLMVMGSPGLDILEDERPFQTSGKNLVKELLKKTARVYSPQSHALARLTQQTPDQAQSALKAVMTEHNCSELNAYDKILLGIKEAKPKLTEEDMEFVDSVATIAEPEPEPEPKPKKKAKPQPVEYGKRVLQLAQRLEISAENANDLIEEMKERGDMGTNPAFYEVLREHDEKKKKGKK